MGVAVFVHVSVVDLGVAVFVYPAAANNGQPGLLPPLLHVLDALAVILADFLSANLLRLLVPGVLETVNHEPPRRITGVQFAVAPGSLADFFFNPALSLEPRPPIGYDGPYVADGGNGPEHDEQGRRPAEAGPERVTAADEGHEDAGEQRRH